MDKNKWVITAVVLVLIVGGGIYWQQSQVTKTIDETIRIGAVLGLTGQAATDSLNIKRGLDLAKSDLAKMGITVDINYQDDNADAKKTVSAVQYLISTYQPQAIVGPVWSYLEDAAGPVIAANKIVAYAPADTSEFVSARSPYNFRGAPQNALIKQPVSDWLRANNKKRVAIIVDKAAFGASVKAPYRTAANEAGASVAYLEEIPTFSSDPVGLVTVALLKAKAANSDVILWSGYEPESAALIKKKAELGLANVPVIAIGNTLVSLLSRNAISANELSGVYHISVPHNPDFVQKFKAVYGEAPGDYADRAYDGLMIIVNAFRNAPQKNGDSIAAYLRENTHYQGYGGLYEFNENGDVKEGHWIIQPIVK